MPFQLLDAYASAPATYYALTKEAQEGFERALLIETARLPDKIARDKVCAKIAQLTKVPKATFREAIEELIDSANPPVDAPVFAYYAKEFWYYSPAGRTWVVVPLSVVTLILRRAKLDPEIEIPRIVNECNVDWAGGLGHYSVGLHHIDGLRVLVTTERRPLTLQPGDISAANIFLTDLFGEGKDPLAQTQLRRFKAWMLRALSDAADAPLGLLGLIGSPSAGKTLLTTLITQVLGGRKALANQYFTGHSTFNAHLLGADVAVISDTEDPCRFAGPNVATARIKSWISNPHVEITTKHETNLTLPHRGVVVLNANIDKPGQIPAFEGESELDRVLYLRCYSPDVEYHSGIGTEEGKTWLRELTLAFASWCFELRSYVPPAEDYDARWGAHGFQHPEIMSLVGKSNSYSDLSALLSDYLLTVTGDAWVGSAAELSDELSAFTSAKNRKLSDSIKGGVDAIGRGLTALQAGVWEGLIASEVRNVGTGTERRKRRFWTILKPISKSAPESAPAVAEAA